MVIHSDRLSDKEQRQKIKGQEEITQKQRRPVLDKEKKIDFYQQWKIQQGVREEEEKGKNTCWRGKTEDRTSN